MQLLALLNLLVAIEARRRQLASDSHFARQKIRHRAEPLTNHYGMYNEPVPVDITNVRKEGLVDPATGQKEPFDALAVSLRFRLPPEEKEKMIQEARARKTIKMSPRAERNRNKEEDDVDFGGKPPKPFDLEVLQGINIGIPGAYSANVARAKSLFRSGPYLNRTGPSYDPKQMLPLDSFNKNPFQDSFDNWTTCEEFAVAARFHPRDVAGVTWETFYIWSGKGLGNSERFEISYPTKKLVYDYKAKYDKLMDVKIDWKQPMLLLKAWMELLLVAADRRGLFIAIPKTEIPENAQNMTFKLQHLTIRMKMVDPYLAMMMCQEPIALLLAPVGEVPPLKERPTIAKTLGFRGVGSPVLPNEFGNFLRLNKAQMEKLEAESEAVGAKEGVEESKFSPFFNDDH